jgi:hypothetical protein
MNMKKRNVCRISVGKPEGRPRCKWEDNTKLDLRETGSGGKDQIDLAQGRDPCEHGNEPSGSITCLGSCTTGGFSRPTQLHRISY